MTVGQGFGGRNSRVGAVRLLFFAALRAAFLQGTDAMHTFEVEVNGKGTTVTETIRANTPASAKNAALARFPGGTLRRIVRVG